MAKMIRPGEKVRGYEIRQLLNKGAMAIAYESVSASGERVFFKQYKSPSVRVEWFKGYVAYQEELKRRLQSARVKHYCYRMVDFFVENWGTPCYFQVFEFVQRGHDLETILGQIQENPEKHPFANRVTLAKVFLAGLGALHEANIIHSDLKPANIQLYEDKTIKTGYQLKLIDMDYSVLADRKAPWHDFQGYIGSPHYFSPEHLAGKPPLKASDVFTAGLILYELLADGHPYPFEGDEYAQAVQAYRVKPPRLAGDTGNNEAVAEMLHRCLAPDPWRRPGAIEIHELLKHAGSKRLSRTTTGPPPSIPSPSPPKPTPTPPEAKPGPPLPPAARTLRLRSESGTEMRLRIRTVVGKHLVQTFGEDSRFWDAEQFALEPKDRQWWVVPRTGAPNETMLNGKAITAPTALKTGDVLAVGREAKGVVKLPLTVVLE